MFAEGAHSCSAIAPFFNSNGGVFRRKNRDLVALRGALVLGVSSTQALGYGWRHRAGAKLRLAARVKKRPARGRYRPLLGRLATEKKHRRMRQKRARCAGGNPSDYRPAQVGTGALAAALLHHPARAQTGNFGLVITQLAENLGGVFAQGWRTTPNLARTAGEINGQSSHRCGHG